VYDRLNYDSLLTRQDPQESFVVLYNRSGTNLTAAYITPEEGKCINSLRIQGFVTDFVMYRYNADSEDHALYLVGVLNSAVVNEEIKPWQTQGLKGERDIARRPFEVCPIPLFNKQDTLHFQIVLAARRAREKVLHWKSSIEGGTAEARRAAKHVIQPELRELNRLVTELLKNHKMKQPTPKKKEEEAPSLFAAAEIA
jgi:hypothetical protein